MLIFFEFISQLLELLGFLLYYINFIIIPFFYYYTKLLLHLFKQNRHSGFS